MTTDRRWLAFMVLTLGSFMIVLDTTITNVALPSIRADLGFTATSLAWVVNAYMLFFGGFLLLGGRLGDLYGHRRLFLMGIVLFTVASLLAGLASSQAVLIAARAAQGLGGAIASATGLSLMMTIFTAQADRAKAMGVVGFVSAGGGSVGVLLGGILVSTFGWHSVFLVNIPVGIAVCVLPLRPLPAAGPRILASAGRARVPTRQPRHGRLLGEHLGEARDALRHQAAAGHGPRARRSRSRAPRPRADRRQLPRRRLPEHGPPGPRRGHRVQPDAAGRDDRRATRAVRPRVGPREHVLHARRRARPRDPRERRRRDHDRVTPLRRHDRRSAHGRLPRGVRLRGDLRARCRASRSARPSHRAATRDRAAGVRDDRVRGRRRLARTRSRGADPVSRMTWRWISSSV